MDESIFNNIDRSMSHSKESSSAGDYAAAVFLCDPKVLYYFEYIIYLE